MKPSEVFSSKLSSASLSNLRIGLIQTAAFEETFENLKKTVTRVEEAARKGAKIICLQELFCHRYFPQVKDKKYFTLAQPIPNFMTEPFCQLARKWKVVIIVPVFEKGLGGKFYNSAVVVDVDGKILGAYQKSHVPDDPCFHEKFYFAPGKTGFKVFDTSYGRIGVLICWDQWFPEAARGLALNGARIIFYPSAIGWHLKEGRRTEEEEAWEVIQRSHAIANGIYVTAVNRVGREEELCFWGKSFVAGPFGEIVTKASDRREAVLLADLDLGRIEEIRKAWPFLRERRVEFYRSVLGKKWVREREAR